MRRGGAGWHVLPVALVVAASALAAAQHARGALVRLLNPYAVSPIEAMPTWASRRVAQGGALYFRVPEGEVGPSGAVIRPLDDLTPLPYGALAYLVPALLARAVGAVEAGGVVIAGRGVAFVSLLAAAGALVAIARRTGAGRRAAWLAPAPLLLGEEPPFVDPYHATLVEELDPAGRFDALAARLRDGAPRAVLTSLHPLAATRFHDQDVFPPPLAAALRARYAPAEVVGEWFVVWVPRRAAP